MNDLTASIGRLEDLGYPFQRQFKYQIGIIERLEAKVRRGAVEGYPGDPLGGAAHEVYESELRALKSVLGEQVEHALAQSQNPMPITRLRFADFANAGNALDDDGPALRAAIKAAATLTGKAIILLEPRTYRLRDFDDSSARYHLVLRGLRHVEMVCEQGEAVLRCEQIGGALLVEDCEYIRLENIGIDFDPLPFTQGRIVKFEADAGEMHWQRDVGYGSPNEPPFTLCEKLSGSIRDATSGEYQPGGFTIHEVTRERDDLWRFKGVCKDDDPTPLSPGKPLVIHSRGVPGARCGLWLRHSRFIHCESVNVYAAYHFAIFVTDCTGTAFYRSRVIPRPHTGRLSSVNADGFHAKSNRQGPYLESCEVSAVPDDCNNVYARMMSVCERVSPRKVVVDSKWNADETPLSWGWRPDRNAFRVGDKLAFIETHTGLVLGVAAVTAVMDQAYDGDRLVAVELDRDITGVISRRDIGQKGTVNRSGDFLRVGPDHPLETFVVNLNTKSDGFALIDSSFHGNAVAGIKLKASNGIITGCDFSRHSWAAIDLCMRLVWQEGYAPHDVLITGNRLNTRFPISANCEYPGGRRSIGPAHISNIRIEDNDLLGQAWDVQLNNTRNSSITGNRLHAVDPIIVHPTCKAIQIADNTASTSKNSQNSPQQSEGARTPVRAIYSPSAHRYH